MVVVKQINYTNERMKTQAKQLIILLLIIIAGQTRAQTIDSFHLNSSVKPHELFVRLKFPDSSYYVERTFDRVALIYPPFNIVTFFYRSCNFIKTSPTRDTMIRIYTPAPYGLRVWLVRDSNTVATGCTFAGETQTVDSASYDSLRTVTHIAHPGSTNNDLYIFPNPAASVLYVSGAPGWELRIFDGLGRLQIRQMLHNTQETVNIHNLVPGMYYIRCYRDGQMLQNHCFNKLP